MGLIGSPETSVLKRLTLRNNPEDGVISVLRTVNGALLFSWFVGKGNRKVKVKRSLRLLLV